VHEYDLSCHAADFVSSVPLCGFSATSRIDVRHGPPRKHAVYAKAQSRRDRQAERGNYGFVKQTKSAGVESK
jgi:hypothetical protein